MPASTSPTELLSINEVEVRTGMKRSNIYRLIQLGLFPAPIHLGGSKWIAAEVEEFIQRLQDERDRQRGENKFAPRPAILSGQMTGAPDGSFSNPRSGTSAAAPTSTVRTLEPEICQAFRMLKLDIPELYQDPTVWSVSLAVMSVKLSPTPQAQKVPKGKKR